MRSPGPVLTYRQDHACNPMPEAQQIGPFQKHTKDIEQLGMLAQRDN